MTYPAQFQRLTFAFLLLSYALMPVLCLAQTTSRERISLNDNWRFTKDDPSNNAANLLYDARPQQSAATNSSTNTSPAFLKQWILPTGNEFISDPGRRFVRPEGDPGADVAYVQPGFDDSSWKQITLPHDWAIEGPFTRSGGGGMGRLPSAGIGWYRKKLNIPESAAGKSIFLDVDGAMSYSAVWLNGRLVGGWPFGYASWRVDLTPYVAPGRENQLVIRLDNPPNSSRWYPGGGIYRNVWLVTASPVHVAHWGTQLTTPEISPTAATVELKVTVENLSKQTAAVRVATEVFALDTAGRHAGSAVARLRPVSAQIEVGRSGVAAASGVIRHPKLWGPPPQQRPNRYVAVTTVSQDGQVVDRYETPFGIRSLKYDPNVGVLINGEHIDLKGVCLHHDLGALGTAVNHRALQRQLEMLMEMGCNAIRTSHNPPAPELLELTDQMGFLVMDETYDVWARQKTPLDFHLIFPDWYEQDLRAHLRRDRNCPSVVMWSIGNEVGEQFSGEDGAAWARKLGDIVHQEDPTRPTTTAMNVARPAQPMPAAVDLIGLNYQGAGIRQTPGQYPAFREKFPGKVIFSSESASAFSSRGEYLFPVIASNSAPVRPGAGGDRDKRQVSAYELYHADFGASADKVFASQERNPFAAGEFVWTGWDYLGEPTPYDASRSSYSGIIDLAGFKKDRFFLYQAHWRSNFPMAHILPHWTWPERVGQVTPVHVFTSGDEGELYLNGQSLGHKRKGPFEYRLRWDDVVYQPGTLRLVAYKNGKKWAVDEIKTAGEPAALKLEPDREKILADGKDLSFITVTVTDKTGKMSPRADHRIHFDIEGPGEILATDNGDPTSLESFQSHDRKAFNGLCLVIVRGVSAQPGRIRLTAKADGLKVGTAMITSASGIR